MSATKLDVLSPGAANRAQSPSAKTFRTYSIHTSRGEAFTVFNIVQKEITQFVDNEEPRSPVKAGAPYVLASWQFKDTPTVIYLNDEVSIGADRLAIIAGPCSIESREQMMETAFRVREAGAHILRGGAFKPRSSPYAFQGMGEEGLRLLKDAGDAAGMPIITEVMDAEDIPLLAEHSDILQVGARNCQNFSLLKKLGRINRPVLLKRGMMMTIEEWLLSAEYILSEGNMNVILCERGIRTFETETRNTLDISAIPVLKAKTHLPVIVDPSHASGSWKLIEPLSLASVAAGADGLMIEVHITPETALCDGNQSLRPWRFADLVREVRPMAGMRGRTM